MRVCTLLLFLSFLNIQSVYSGPSISSTLLFMKSQIDHAPVSKIASAGKRTPVTIRFKNPPSASLIDEIENHGVTFARSNGSILHTRTIYPASVVLDSLESLGKYDSILRIEGSTRPAAAPTLDVSNPQVQASYAWNTAIPGGSHIDGSGVIVTNVDTGIDIYHPAFFKPDNGVYDWIDGNGDGVFSNAQLGEKPDYVDLDHDGIADPLEILRFFDSSFSDPNQINLMEYENGVFETDIDWLYNDHDRDNRRDYGPANGFRETDPCFGELLFVVDDSNGNNRLDPGEKLIGLGSSRIVGIFDEKGEHLRGQNLFTSVVDVTDHGTPSCGIVGGQIPGRRLVGMAPGVEFISINRSSLASDADNRDDLYHSVEAGLLWARKQGSQIMMYEYGSWIYEFLDGSSNMEILINELYDEGIHQFTASGNLAGPTRKKHALLELGPGEQASLPFSVPAVNVKEVYITFLWNDVLNPPNFTLVRNGFSLTLTTPLNHDINSRVYDGTLGSYDVMWTTEKSDRNTVKLDVSIKSGSATTISGTMQLNITGNPTSGAIIDAYISDDVTSWMHGTQFQAYVTDDGTVTTPGTADEGVTVGAYDPRGKRNEKGAINDFSSWGNTIDGRRAVDIVAPGSDVYSISSHFKHGGDPGGYLAFGGTSSALPHVVGCAALILQASPYITPPMLEQVLYDGAGVDTFTGSNIPNDMWGYGKLRVLDSLLKANLCVSVTEDPVIPDTFSVSNAFPNPFNNTTSFAISYILHDVSPVKVSVYSLSGQLVFSSRLTPGNVGSDVFSWNGVSHDGVQVSSGVYLFRFSDGVSSLTRRAVLLK